MRTWNPWRGIERFLRDESGPTAVEYAVLLALILGTIIIGVSAFGNAQDSYWGRIDNSMQAHGIN
jgi:pilus assembly protein Flp/PilA